MRFPSFCKFILMLSGASIGIVVTVSGQTQENQQQSLTCSTDSAAVTAGESYGAIDGALDVQRHQPYQYKIKGRYRSPAWNSSMGDKSTELKNYQCGYAQGYKKGYQSSDTVLKKYQAALKAGKN